MEPVRGGGRSCRAEKGSSSNGETQAPLPPSRCSKLPRRCCANSSVDLVARKHLESRFHMRFIEKRKPKTCMDLVAEQLMGLFLFKYMDVNTKWKWKNPSFLVFLNTALRMSGFIPCFCTKPQWASCASPPIRLTYSVMFSLGYFQSGTPASGSDRAAQEFLVLCSSEIPAFEISSCVSVS